MTAKTQRFVFLLAVLALMAQLLPGAASACVYTIDPIEASFDAAGGSGSIAVATFTGCVWTAVSNNGWIHITSGENGEGPGITTYTVSANPYPSDRQGRITIAGIFFTVSQTGLVVTDFSVSDMQPDIGETVIFTVPSGLTPEVWHFGDENCDGDLPVVQCATLPDAECRTVEWSYRETGLVQVYLKTSTGEKAKTLWVQDRGECPPPCVADGPPTASFTIDPDPAVVGQTVTFTDTSGSPKAAIDALGFTWDPIDPQIGELVEFEITGVTGVSLAQWAMGEEGCAGYPEELTCTPLYTNCLEYGFKFASGGAKTVTLSATNLGGSTLGPVSHEITVQNTGSCSGGGGSCTYSLDPSTAAFPASGGAGAIAISTQDGCAWSATASASWVSITSGASGTGSGAITYTVAANTDAARTANLEAGGKNHGIIQAAGDDGYDCIYAIAPPDASFPADGGSGSIAVATQAGCEWTAISDVEWLHITAGPSGSGVGLVLYDVAENTPGEDRAGTILVAGREHHVEQTGGGTIFDPTDWQWQILLDGVQVTSSEQQDFSYVFAEPGLYEVRLTAGNCMGEDTQIQSLQVDSAPVPEPQGYFVPAAVHTPGLNDTLWKTDLRFFNPGDEPVNVNIVYLPEATNNSGGLLYGINFPLDAKATRVFDDMVQAIPGVVGDDNKGSMRIFFHDGLGGQPAVNPMMVSRTYNDTPNGTFGQFVPALPVLPVQGDEIYLTGLVENLSFRSNLGLANLGPDDTWVQITLIPHGNSLGRTVPGNSTIQVIQVAEAAGVSDAVNIFSVKIDTYDGEIFAYASVVDNTTGDPVLYLPYGAASTEVFIPGVAHLPGLNASTWRSDMTLFNPTDSVLAGRVSYIPADNISERPYLDFDTMATMVTYTYVDVLGHLLTPDSKGYFILTGIDGSVVPQAVFRTYNVEADGGTFGQALKVFGAEDLIGQGQTGCLVGLANSPVSDQGFRTNLGLVNTDQDSSTELLITLYGEDGTVIGEISNHILAPGQLQQWNLFQEMGLDDQETTATSLMVEVLTNGPLAAYASVVDNQTQDPILIPAQIVIPY